jgi:hypothetical protein
VRIVVHRRQEEISSRNFFDTCWVVLASPKPRWHVDFAITDSPTSLNQGLSSTAG